MNPILRRSLTSDQILTGVSICETAGLSGISQERFSRYDAPWGQKDFVCDRNDTVFWKQLSSPLCALAAQSEAIHFKSKGRAQIACDDGSLRPASYLDRYFWKRKERPEPLFSLYLQNSDVVIPGTI